MRMLTRREFLKTSLAFPATVVAAGLYAWRVEPHWLEVVHREMPILGLPAALAGATLVQLSDVHVGPRVSDDYILETFGRVAALEPDIVCLTGDMASHHPDVVAHARRVYAKLPHGRLATVAVLGNHDYGHGWADGDKADQLAGVLTDLGVRVLRNERVDVSGLQIVGMDDLWARRFRPVTALAGIELTAPMLALSHNPDTADLPGWEPFTGWILSGHTHGGQVHAPFLPPPVLPVENRRYTSGEFSLSGGRTMYISRGVGHNMQVRFDVRPEVTVFNLVPA
jgi:predicted MPP superfamily phosphohydrolase